MASTKEVKKKEIQKIEESKYQEFKQKFDEMIEVFRIAAIVDVACISRECVDRSKNCLATILNKGKSLAKSFGTRAQDYMEEVGVDSPELDDYNDALELIDEQFQDRVSLIVAEQKRTEALLENAMITRAKVEYKKTMAMNTPEYEKYKSEITKLNTKAESVKKLKSEVEKAKKLAAIAEEMENLTDRGVLNTYIQQIDEANRQIDAALEENEACEKALDALNIDYQKALDKHVNDASNQTDLVEQKEEGFFKQLFNKLARLFKGNSIKQFQDNYEMWLKGEVADIENTVGSRVRAANQKFEELEQNVDDIEQNNLGRLSGIGRNIVESVKAGLNSEGGVRRTIKTGVTAIITASETISKTNSEKMFDGLEGLSITKSKEKDKEAATV